MDRPEARVIVERQEMSLRRLTDVILSAVLLFVCLPALLLSCLAVCAEQRSWPLVRLERVLRDGRIVRLFRLRVMRPTQFGPRETRSGAVLRRLHLDEIPQLFNVLAGDLSLIGSQPAALGQIGPKKAFALRQP